MMPKSTKTVKAKKQKSPKALEKNSRAEKICVFIKISVKVKGAFAPYLLNRLFKKPDIIKTANQDQKE
jgi:hypothetical protein